MQLTICLVSRHHGCNVQDCVHCVLQHAAMRNVGEGLRSNAVCRHLNTSRGQMSHSLVIGASQRQHALGPEDVSATLHHQLLHAATSMLSARASHTTWLHAHWCCVKRNTAKDAHMPCLLFMWHSSLRRHMWMQQKEATLLQNSTELEGAAPTATCSGPPGGGGPPPRC